MRMLFRTGLMVSAMVLGLSTHGTARAASGFDGVYAGVSAKVSGPAECPTAETPGPITVANGNITSATGFFTGVVDAAGHVVLHTKESTRYDGQIDASGVLKAGGGTPRCAYSLVWKKR